MNASKSKLNFDLIKNNPNNNIVTYHQLSYKYDTVLLPRKTSVQADQWYHAMLYGLKKVMPEVFQINHKLLDRGHSKTKTTDIRYS
jgi:hypothetical protein